MDHLAYLCVLLLVVASASQPSEASSVDQQWSRLKEGACLPDDVASLSSADCRGEAGPTQELKCIASGAGISTPLGYDQAALDSYIAGLTSDDLWVTRQRERLANCSAMMLDQVPAEAEGVFLLACWHQMMVSYCNRRRMVTMVAAVDPGNAEELVDEVADMAEGSCFDSGLKYAEELGTKWADCAAKNSLDMGVLTGAAYVYYLFTEGQEIPEPSVESNTAALEQLDRLNATAHCYARSSGEVTAEGGIDFDLINNATRDAVGREEFRAVDRALVEFCRDQSPASIGEFYACFRRAKPFGCAVIKSYDIALGRVESSGAAGVEAPTVAPTVSVLAGLLGSLF